MSIIHNITLTITLNGLKLFKLFLELKIHDIKGV